MKWLNKKIRKLQKLRIKSSLKKKKIIIFPNFGDYSLKLAAGSAEEIAGSAE
jgi:hypothetical protein